MEFDALLRKWRSAFHHLQLLAPSASARQCNAAQPEIFERSQQHIWQKRFYDFNVWTDRKRVEKLRYIHRNLVKRGLVESPELWRWSSYRAVPSARLR